MSIFSLEYCLKVALCKFTFLMQWKTWSEIKKWNITVMVNTILVLPSESPVATTERITEGLRLKGTSEDNLIQLFPTPTKTGSARASCPGSFSSSFWISTGTPPLLWATYASTQSPSQLKYVFWSSGETCCVSVFMLCSDSLTRHHCNISLHFLNTCPPGICIHILISSTMKLLLSRLRVPAHSAFP